MFCPLRMEQHANPLGTQMLFYTLWRFWLVNFQKQLWGAIWFIWHKLETYMLVYRGGNKTCSKKPKNFLIEFLSKDSCWQSILQCQKGQGGALGWALWIEWVTLGGRALWKKRDTLREVVFTLREGMGTLREWAPWEGTMGWKGTLRERVGTLREWAPWEGTMGWKGTLRERVGTLREWVNLWKLWHLFFHNILRMVILVPKN